MVIPSAARHAFADQVACETASDFGSLAACFCATSFAARTVRSLATGALWRTVGCAAVARCSGTCCIWARLSTMVDLELRKVLACSSFAGGDGFLRRNGRDDAGAVHQQDGLAS